MDEGITPPSTNCAKNRVKTNAASRRDMDRLVITASAKNDCAAVRKSSSRCTASSGSPWKLCEVTANTMGSVPTSSVHWFTFELTSVPRAEFELRRQA